MWGLLHLVQLAEDFLYVPGVIGMLAGQTRVTRHVDAPFVSHIPWSIIDDAGFVVSPVMSSASTSFSFQVLTGKMGTCPMMRVQDENNPVSLLQCPFCEVIFHPIGPKATP